MSFTYERFERTLAWHCAPSLAGIKAADMVSWDPSHQDWPQLLGHYVLLLAKRGIQLKVLGRSGGRTLLLTYRPRQLEGWLAQPEVAAMLAREGYPVGEGLHAMLAHLRSRIRPGEEFPHEIGLFLGYPPADVEGFRRDGGRNYKLQGLWKVYGDVEEASRRFAAFQRCRNALSRRVAQGHSLAQVFPAA